jgi:curved DNA-binding protein CbpA
MPSTDDLLYKELGVDRQASAKSIKHAYRRLALRHHPDKDPQGTEKFKNISEAFQVLSDPDRRKKYDAQGYQAVLHRDPANRNNTGNDAEGVAQAAKDEFDDFLEGLDDDVDQEIDDLLDWWSNPGLDTSKVKTCLRIESDDFFDQLVALYDQYRLTHYATTNDERSKQVTPSM